MVSQHAVIVWESDLVSDWRCVECERDAADALYYLAESARKSNSLYLISRKSRSRLMFFLHESAFGFFLSPFFPTTSTQSMTARPWQLKSGGCTPVNLHHCVAPLHQPPPLSYIKGLCIFRCTCIQISISSRIIHSSAKCLQRHWWEKFTFLFRFTRLLLKLNWRCVNSFDKIAI